MTRDEALRILGLEADATLDDAKKAYRTLARITHPDKDSSPGANQRFILVQNAHEVFANTEPQAQNNQARAEKTRQEREARERAQRERQAREAREEREHREREHRERERRERERRERERRERENAERERQEQERAEEEWRRRKEHYEDVSGGRVERSSEDAFQTPKTIGHFLFLFKGRITRRSFWVYLFARILLIVLTWVVPFASRLSTPVDVTLLLLCYCDICVAVKRFHDRNKPGIWCIIILFPTIGFFWFFIELGFLKGTDGPNAYGADPTKS